MSRIGETARRHWPVLALCATSAVVAVVLKHWLFPLQSINNDEAVYQLQADAIARGHMFPAAPAHAESFVPWLAVIRGGHYVLHYSLVLPALMALSTVLVGRVDLYLAVVAAGAVGMTYALALEVLGTRREALVAAVIVATSPMIMLHSALQLSYLPTLLLLQAYAWTLVRGLRRRDSGLLALAGLALGVALHVRPYDALLFGPVMLVAAWWHRPTPRQVIAFAVPLLGAIAAFLLLNLIATSNPFVPPFTLLEPADRFGFGERKLYPAAGFQTFSIFEAVEGFVAHARLLLSWLAGGPVLLALALAGVRRAGVEARTVGVAACIVSLGYFVFWGPWAATVLWGGALYLGPFYFLGVVIPAAVFGARALVRSWDRARLPSAAVVALMVALTAVTTANAVGDHLDFKHQQAAVLSLARDASDEPKIVFTRTLAPFLQHPVGALGNGAVLGGDVVYAVQRGADDLDAYRMFSERTPFVLATSGDLTDEHGVEARIQRLEHAMATQLEIPLQLKLPPGSWVVELEVKAFGRARTYDMPYTSGTHSEHLAIDRTGARLTGHGDVADAPARRAPPAPGAPLPTDRGVVVTLYMSPTSAGVQPQTWEADRIAVRRVGSSVEGLVPVGPVRTTPGLFPRVIVFGAP